MLKSTFFIVFYRISIQHVSVHKPKKVSISEDGEEDVEAKIYAISSEGGNVIYHLSQPGRQTNLMKLKAGNGWNLGNTQKSPEDLQSYALSVMNTKTGTASTAPVRTHSVTDLSFERVNPQDISLRINPFGSASSLDKLIFDGYDFPQSASMPNLEGVKRLDSTTCKKEGIFFDGSDVVEDHFKADSPVHSEDSQKDSNSKDPRKVNDQTKSAAAAPEKILTDTTASKTAQDCVDQNGQKFDEKTDNDQRVSKPAENGDVPTNVTPPVITVITRPSPTEEENRSKDEMSESLDRKDSGSSVTLSETEGSDSETVDSVVRSILDEIVSSAVASSRGREDSVASDVGSSSRCEGSTHSPGDDNQSSEDWRKMVEDGGEDSTDSDSDNAEFQSLVASSASESHQLQLQSSQNDIANAGSMDSLLNSRGGAGYDDEDEEDEDDQQDPKDNGNHNILLGSSTSSYCIDHRNLDPSTDIHELHLHMLLYAQQYDFRRTVYALSTLRAMLHNCPRLVVTAMATTSISSVKAPHLAKLQSLLGE